MFGLEKIPNFVAKNKNESTETIKEEENYKDIVNYRKNYLTNFFQKHPEIGKITRNIAFTTINLGAVLNADSLISQNIEKIDKNESNNIKIVVAEPKINIDNEKTLLISQEMLENSYNHDGEKVYNIDHNISGNLLNEGENIIITHQSILATQATEKNKQENILSTMHDKTFIYQNEAENNKAEGEPILVKNIGKNTEEAITNALAEASDQIGLHLNSATENKNDDDRENTHNSFSSLINIESSNEIKSYRLISSRNIANDNVEVEIEVIPYLEH